jgi:broad specificity phosphatase PhoE
MARLRHDWPRRLWVVRHGESAGNVASERAEEAGAQLIDLATRDADTPLSALGHRQSEALARWFADMPAAQRPTVIYVSPFVRARQTAEHIARVLGLPRSAMALDERLREREFGVLDMHTRHGIAARFPELHEQRRRVGKFYFRPPGGESWCDVILRLRSVVEVLRRDHARDRVLVVAHQVLVNCARYLLENLDEATLLALVRRAEIANCGVTEYQRTVQDELPSMRLVRFNYVLPLADAGEPVTRSADVPGGPR